LLWRNFFGLLNSPKIFGTLVSYWKKRSAEKETMQTKPATSAPHNYKQQKIIPTFIICQATSMV
jgi:hypothetical protein